VFDGTFPGGLRGFKDIPASPFMPPMSEEDLNLVMHIELCLIGGHVLMGTDAPESMGFKFNLGNNIHINLETDSKEESDKLFMPLHWSAK
jgi:PhnB protein